MITRAPKVFNHGSAKQLRGPCRSPQVSELLTAPVISPGVRGEEPPAASALGGICG